MSIYLEEMVPTLTLEEVFKHRFKHDCWIIVHNNIYNCTEFLSEHPGGPDLIFDLGGKDATEEYDEIGHSFEASNRLSLLKIGKLSIPEGYTAPKTLRQSLGGTRNDGQFHDDPIRLDFVSVLIGIVGVVVGGILCLI